MKPLLLAFLIFASLSISAQKNKGYGNVGITGTSALDGGFGATFSAGYHVAKPFTVGLAFDVIKMNNYDKARTVIYADLRYYYYQGLFITGQVGYSIFTSDESKNGVQTQTEGGIYYGGGLGFEIAKMKVSPFIILKYNYYPHTETITRQVRVSQTQYKKVVTNYDYSEMAPTFTIGVRF